MIGRLTGTVTQEDDGNVVVDVGGVGYEVTVPLGTLGRATTDAEGRATLFVHTHVREDAFLLFGFASDADRLAFRTLIGVSSVGPKMAIAILSSLPAPELGAAIARKELGRLTAISGVGKKTAERLLLELKDKLPVFEAAAHRGASRTPTPSRDATAPTPTGELLARALTSMGYRPSEAERAVEQLRDRLDEVPLADLIKEALAFLAK